MSDWLHDVRINQPLFADIPGVDEVIDSLEAGVDFLKKASPLLNQAITDFETKILELARQSLFLPAGRVIRIIGLVVTGEKILKLIVGTDDEGGGSGKALGQFDLSALADPEGNLPVSEVFQIIAESARARLTAAGLTVADPTFLADPAV